MNTIPLRSGSFPCWVIRVSVEWMVYFRPSILESVNGVEVLLLTQCQYKVFVLNYSSIFKSDFVSLRVDLFDTNVI